MDIRIPFRRKNYLSIYQCFSNWKISSMKYTWHQSFNVKRNANGHLRPYIYFWYRRLFPKTLLCPVSHDQVNMESKEREAQSFFRLFRDFISFLLSLQIADSWYSQYCQFEEAVIWVRSQTSGWLCCTTVWMIFVVSKLLVLDVRR